MYRQNRTPMPSSISPHCSLGATSICTETISQRRQSVPEDDWV